MSEDRPWFDTDRKQQSLSLDKRAEKFYKEFWNVQQLRSLESGKLEYARDDDEKSTIELFDCAGIDLLLYADKRYITVAQRWRPNSGRYNVDFSVRLENGSTESAEFVKHLESYRRHGLLPSVYSFGIHNGDTFDEFYLIDARAVLRAYDEGDLEVESHGKKYDGTMAGYIKIEDLEEQGCILQAWPEGWVEQ